MGKLFVAALLAFVPALVSAQVPNISPLTPEEEAHAKVLLSGRWVERKSDGVMAESEYTALINPDTACGIMVLSATLDKMEPGFGGVVLTDVTSGKSVWVTSEKTPSFLNPKTGKQISEKDPDLQPCIRKVKDPDAGLPTAVRAKFRGFAGIK